jgi:hypothetical protein
MGVIRVALWIAPLASLAGTGRCPASGGIEGGPGANFTVVTYPLLLTGLSSWAGRLHVVVAKAQDKGPLKMCLRLLPCSHVSSPGSTVKATLVGIGGITGWETSRGSAVVTVVIVGGS